MGHSGVNNGSSPLEALIAAERQRRGLIRRELAELVRKAGRRDGAVLGVSEETVKGWELRGHVPQPPALRALAAVLEMPIERLAALARRSSEPIQQEDDDTERRGFLSAMAAVSIGMLDPELLAAALGAPRQADSRLMDDLQALTNEYGRMYWNMRPAALWPTFYGQVAVTRRIHKTAKPSLQVQAATIASQSASMLGMLAHRLDRRLDSIMYLNLADELAAEAGDGPLRAHALVALRAAYSPVTGPGSRADPAKALQLTTDAINAAGAAAPPVLLTWLHACRAEDYAVLGNASETDQDMESAGAALAHSIARSTGFFEHWDDARLAGFRGNCAVLLGQPDKAIPILESVVRDTSPALVAPYTAVLTDLAGAYGQRGDVEHACAILDDVLTTASRVAMPERAGRVRRTRDSRLAKWADSRSVQQLDEHLREFASAETP